MKPITGNKKPHLTQQPDVNRGFKDIYDTLNKLIDAVNSSFLPHETFKGKRGDIRVNDEGFQYHDGRNWQRIASGTDGNDEPALMMSTDLPRVPANTMYQGNSNGRIQASSLQYPSADGSANQPIITNGSGVLSMSDTVALSKITATGDLTIDTGGSLDLDIGGVGPFIKLDSLQSRFYVYHVLDKDDYFYIQVGTHGLTTFKTFDDTSSNLADLKMLPRGDFIIDANEDVSIDAGSGKFQMKKGGAEFSATDSAYAGMILGYTAIGIDAASDSYGVTASFAVTDADHKVTFVSPPSGKVEIEVTCAVMAIAKRQLYLGLSDNATYAPIHFPNTDDVTNQHHVGDIQQYDFAYNLTHKWVVEGLTAGTSYTWWLGAKAEQAGRITVYWGGNADGEYAPFIMKATALPATIHDGT